MWLAKVPSLGPHPLRWEIGTKLRNPVFHDYCSADYVEWPMHFAPKLLAEIVEIATNFTEDDSPGLYMKITGHIDDEMIKAF